MPSPADEENKATAAPARRPQDPVALKEPPVNHEEELQVQSKRVEPPNLDTLPTELLLIIMESSQNLGVLTVNKKLKELESNPVIKRMVVEQRPSTVLAICRDTNLRDITPNAAHQALANLFGSCWFSSEKLYRVVCDWVWNSIAEAATTCIKRRILDPVQRAINLDNLHQSLRNRRNDRSPKREFDFRVDGVGLHSMLSIRVRVSTQGFGIATGYDWNPSYQVAISGLPSERDTFLPDNMPNTIVPDQFLSGPWTQEEGDKLTFLLSCIAWRVVMDLSGFLSSRQQALAKQGLTRALSTGSLPALIILSRPWEYFSRPGMFNPLWMPPVGLAAARRTLDFSERDRLGPWTSLSNSPLWAHRVPMTERHLKLLDRATNPNLRHPYWDVVLGMAEAMHGTQRRRTRSGNAATAGTSRVTKRKAVVKAEGRAKAVRRS